MIEDRGNGWIQCASGTRFWPLEPRPEEVNIGDIAAALSKLCRFVGHVREFHSVAAHSVLVADALPPRLQLLGLLHDAPEAYTGDISRPLKHQLIVRSGLFCLVDFSAAEGHLMAVILEALAPDLRPTDEDWELVHRADDAALVAEVRDLFARPPHPQWRPLLESVEPLSVRVESLPPAEAEARFLEKFQRLSCQGAE